MRSRDHLPEGMHHVQKQMFSDAGIIWRVQLSASDSLTLAAIAPNHHTGLHAYLLVHVANVDGDLGVAEVSEGRGGAIVLPRDGLLLASRPAGRADGRGRLS